MKPGTEEAESGLEEVVVEVKEDRIERNVDIFGEARTETWKRLSAFGGREGKIGGTWPRIMSCMTQRCAGDIFMAVGMRRKSVEAGATTTCMQIVN